MKTEINIEEILTKPERERACRVAREPERKRACCVARWREINELIMGIGVGTVGAMLGELVRAPTELVSKGDTPVPASRCKDTPAQTPQSVLSNNAPEGTEAETEAALLRRF